MVTVAAFGLLGGWMLTWLGQVLTNILRVDLRTLPVSIVVVAAIMVLYYRTSTVHAAAPQRRGPATVPDNGQPATAVHQTLGGQR